MRYKRKGLWWGGLITGVLGAGGVILFVQGVAFDAHVRLPGPIAWFDVVASTLVIFGSVYIACKLNRIGVAILIAATILVSTVNSILSLPMEFGVVGIFLIAIPASALILVSGLLFLLSGKDEQKHPDNEIAK